jgi:hypothetical protein
MRRDIVAETAMQRTPYDESGVVAGMLAPGWGVLELVDVDVASGRSACEEHPEPATRTAAAMTAARVFTPVR